LQHKPTPNCPALAEHLLLRRRLPLLLLFLLLLTSACGL
jgi:hypothetical protein